jgi:hypothetical protein
MNTNQWRPVLYTALFLGLVAVTTGCAEQGAMTRPETSATSQAVAEPAEASAILMRMAKFLAETPRYSVKVQANYDVVQQSGQKIEFSEHRNVTVSRPNGLRVEAEHSDGERHLVLYDGKNITVFSQAQNVYAQTSKPGGIDEAVMYFLKDLGMRLPLAVLLTSRFPAEIERRTQSIDYVERTEIHGAPTHHLAGRTETVDYQVWIAEGAEPLPLRVVLTYKTADGQPQFRAQFSEWNRSPEVQDSLFTFAAPEGARKIAFLVELHRVALQGAAAPEQSGEKK